MTIVMTDIVLKKGIPLTALKTPKKGDDGKGKATLEIETIKPVKREKTDGAVKKGKGEGGKRKFRKPIPKMVRVAVWRTKVGEKYWGSCYSCRGAISVFDYECGHIKSDKEGGTATLDNLVPICSVCNKSMGAQDLYEAVCKYGMPGAVPYLRSNPKEYKKAATLAAIHLILKDKVGSGGMVEFIPADVMMPEKAIRKCVGGILEHKGKNIYVLKDADWHLIIT